MTNEYGSLRFSKKRKMLPTATLVMSVRTEVVLIHHHREFAFLSRGHNRPGEGNCSSKCTATNKSIVGQISLCYGSLLRQDAVYMVLLILYSDIDITSMNTIFALCSGSFNLENDLVPYQKQTRFLSVVLFGFVSLQP